MSEDKCFRRSFDSSSDYADEAWDTEEDLSPPGRPPVALRAVTKALSRNWQVIDKAPPPAPGSEDEHYLSLMNRLVARTEHSTAESEQQMLLEIWRMIASKTRQQLDELREVREQLDREITQLQSARRQK